MGPVSVEELDSVEDAPSARFARYGIKINMEPRLKKTLVTPKLCLVAKKITEVKTSQNCISCRNRMKKNCIN